MKQQFGCFNLLVIFAGLVLAFHCFTKATAPEKILQTEIKSLKTYTVDEAYEHYPYLAKQKTVAIKGQVVKSWTAILVSGYLLQDLYSEQKIKVITYDFPPNNGTLVKVAGKLQYPRGSENIRIVFEEQGLIYMNLPISRAQ